MLTSYEKINIFRNLFKGREDVFAVRWEKRDGSSRGYTPVCLNEWKQELCNKLQRKKCKDCDDKMYAQFSDYYVEQHLRGNKCYGIYPLLKDNTSYFIVADFDGKKWQNEVLRFLNGCQKYNLPAYLERSRSGNGGHIWIFFKDKYPAYKSRNIAIHILREVKIIDQFEKEDAFDRLFPNQDVHSGEGFGNLIALPLQGESRNAGNSIFLDWKNNLDVLIDQWEYLSNVEKVPLKKLDEIYDRFNKESKTVKKISRNKLRLVLREQIFINKNNLPKVVVNFLKEKLNFANLEFIIRKRIGVNVYGLEKYFKLIENQGDEVAIPRGFINELVVFLNEQNIKFEIIDERIKLKPVKFETSCKLFDYQEEAVREIITRENGLLVSPPGSGKTIIGIDIIAKLKQPTLILVHKKQIFDQWLERIEDFTNVSKREIGQYVSSKKKVGKKITVAMVQTLSRMENLEELKDKFGLIIIDECHHMPAKMFRSVVTKLNPFYLYGLTATPERKNNDGNLIPIYLGEILHKIENNFRVNEKELTRDTPKVIINETDLGVPFKVKADNFQLLSKIIVFDSNRNRQIVEDIKKEANSGRKCLVLTERKEHIEVLGCYLKKEFEVIEFSGDLTEKKRREKTRQINDGNFQILLATGQLIGEGTDFQNLESLFLVFPFAFQGKLIQYIGRIQRENDGNNKIYDYRDKKVEYLERFFKKRLRYYKKNGYL
ncbi:MAG TPA: restriction endonuclease subunit R [Candidatus Moranbacteria bacterium]|nr:MAG: Type III restriction protein res subunit [Candidatus Moranbacteria bacterium GW2011_GWF1_34_10]HBI16717.1 restriction endonuclease subunit R [Candidatus Moranbacteria bacterium]